MVLRLRDMCTTESRGEGPLATFLNGTAVRRLLDDHGSGRKDNWLQIWTLLGLSIWDELFCRRPISAAKARFGVARRSVA
jgi:hypothetical protein